MIWAYQQRLDPFHNTILWSNVWSIILAALPVVTLFWLLVMRRWLAPKAAAGGAIVAFLIAVIVYQMPPVMTGMAFVSGAAFGLLPVGFFGGPLGSAPPGRGGTGGLVRSFRRPSNAATRSSNAAIRASRSRHPGHSGCSILLR